MPLAFLLLGVSGVLVRLVFLLLTRQLAPQGDESSYLYLAVVLNRFEIYSDHGAFLWPPGYAYALSLFLKCCGATGPVALKALQVLLSGAIGCATMMIADRLFGRRAALLAGALWCVYLPLIGYTHYLWPETIFLSLLLPAIYLFLRVFLEKGSLAPHTWRVAVAALLLGIAIYFKEVGVYLAVIYAALLVWKGRSDRFDHGLRLAALFVLVIAAVVLPWTLRNRGVYGRWVPVSSTLGRNVFAGVNARYYNSEYPRDLRPRVKSANLIQAKLVSSDGIRAWSGSHLPNVIDRARENVRRVRRFVVRNPAYVLRLSIARLADILTPNSFFLRHYALDRYEGVLDKPTVRRLLIVVCVMLPMLTLAGSIPGLVLALRDPAARLLLGVTIGYFLMAGIPTIAMSRYRAPVEPILMVLAAGFLTGQGRPWSRRGRAKIVALTASFALVILWTINAKSLAIVLGSIW